MQQHDVILVGGGGAGLRAAIAVAEAAPELSVAVVSKVYPMRSHTVSAEGGAAAVIKDNDSLDHHCYDTISGADWLADQDAVEAFVNEAPAEMIRLEHWGCPWSREPSGKIAVRPFGGMKIERTWFAADKTGFHMLHTLFQTSLKYRSVTRYDEHTVTDLIVEDGQCKGVVAYDMPNGELVAIAGKAVIMCTGGAGKIFPFTTNAAIKTGDGMAISYRAGVPLKDMEFVQYHPTGLPGTGILITEASRSEGGILLNNKNRRYLEDYDLGKPLPVTDPNHPVKRTMEMGPRDRLSQAFYHEQKKGNTIQTDYGPIVYLDVRHLGEEKINKKIPFVRELCTSDVGIDPVHELIPVRPVVHYMMGGIDTNIEAETPMPGLYAAGETACVSINGANRLGSNSLTELLVFGARAGKNAAKFAQKQKAFVAEAKAKEIVAARRAVIASFTEGGRTEKIAKIRGELHHTMEEGAGIYRDEASLKMTTEKIAELKKRYASLGITDKSKTFNTEVVAALELGYVLDCAEALAHSALERTESRGSHQRTDYPTRRDVQFLKHSLAYRDPEGGAPRIEYRDVVITRWPPRERTYGAASGLSAEKMTPKDAPAKAKEAEKAET